VTLHKPPNNKLFDNTSQSRMSPVLQRRKEQHHLAAATASPPIFNISLGNDFANLLQRPAAPMAAPAPPPLPIQALPSLALLHSSRLPGIDIPLSQFFELYHLDDHILKKFIDNGYTRSRMLRFVQIEELKEMQFLLGEIAGLKDAVERWSIAA
jgi:hypothetical protein